MTDADDLFQFPCEFPIKVMGRDSESPLAALPFGDALG